MFKSAAILSATVLATAGLAAPASAATFVPNPLANVTFTGNLNIVQLGSNATCAVTLRGFVPGGGSAVMITAASFSGGSFQCRLYTSAGLPWKLIPNTATSVTLQGFSFNTTVGSCSGNVTTSWANGTPSAMVFSGATLPGSPAPCTITGTLNSSPNLTII